MTRIPNTLRSTSPTPRISSPLSDTSSCSGETDTFEITHSDGSTICGSPRSRTPNLSPQQASSKPTDIARQLINRAAPYLWSGELEKAENIVTARDATAHSAPENRAELNQFRATLYQFQGSAALQQGQKSSLFFIRAQAALAKAGVDAHKILDAGQKQKALYQIEFRFLLIERAMSSEKVSKKLAGAFEQMLPKLSDSYFDQNTGLIFHIMGEHAKAKEKWFSLLKARNDDYASRLVLCRLGVTESALGNYKDAASYLERGLVHLASFPERRDFQDCWEITKARSNAG